MDYLTKWIINLSPKKTFVIFGLLHPLYFIWLRKVGLFVIEKNKKNKTQFDILSLILILIMFSSYIIGFIILIGNSQTNIFIKTDYIIPLTIMTIWLLCNWIASKNMIDFENSNDEYFAGFSQRYKKYIFRFFHLLYFPFSIYWIQMEVNKYTDLK